MNSRGGFASKTATPRRYLMCPPEHFAVTYAINPWMRPDEPTDVATAMRQWAELRQVYLDLGHDVRTIEPVPGLPDMVFAANGATVVGGTVLGVRFRHPQRAGEAGAYLQWFRDRGYPRVRVPRYVNEGEGDIVFTERVLLASAATRPPGTRWRGCSGCR
jgi:N-dimethylarginine dimethylaminohydrolase